jgi:hypothetical protein
MSSRGFTLDLPEWEPGVQIILVTFIDMEEGNFFFLLHLDQNQVLFTRPALE